MLADLLAGTLPPWQGWLIAGVLLGIAEIVAPGIFLIWIAIAAGLTGIVAFLLPVPLWLQVLLFALLCVVATYLGRRWYAAQPGESQDPLLNDRIGRLIGRTATVSTGLAQGSGHVKVGDSIWPCEGPDLPPGSLVRITGADGTTLRVEPCDQPGPAA
jgi:hypothetical protein